MLTAVSTNELVQTQAPINPLARNICSVAIILSCLSANCTPVIPVQPVYDEQTALFSTDITGESAYYNRNVCLSWDGVSVMSADRTKSLLRILDIEKLPDNWNGNGATSFTKEILATAKSIIMQLSIQPHIFPTARDSIQFEYENDMGDYLEFELFDNGMLKVFTYSHSGNTDTNYIEVCKMNEVVNKFYGRNI